MLHLEQYYACQSSAPLVWAFPTRSPLPWITHKSLQMNDSAATWAQLVQRERSGKNVAYIHVPFCANHCLFCNFYTNRSTSNALRQYVDRVILELALECNRPAFRSSPIQPRCRLCLSPPR